MKGISLKEISSDWRAYLAEFLATLAFVFITCLAVLSNQFYGQIGDVGVALAIGFSYAALVFASAHIAGGYLNPAVTLALWLAGRMSHIKAVFLIIAQIAASFAAAALIYWIFGSNAQRFFLGMPSVGIGIEMAGAIAIEAILTAALVFVVFATAVDRRGPVSFSALALGLYVTCATIAALAISGAVLNPARAIGPAVLSQSYESLAVWLIGPVTGSLFGPLYEVVFLRKGKKG
ncbi:hypothetical protein A3A60_01190 [Candidatus Curtissbacteria bacterium RIFCSPLOWO2_01_FULL_42_26]|uniref:Aquaporin n=1 Tax=Candidatus Curtissbacteria bacterium RIFCSPLOWO2_01_FULL_42_26 TaxID=1797729 RepID=A0A1F5HY85_9BACT|nr:MAG: hypothetical protein A3A60_01190 [Candidatus Curtissbacteria bacterium RIFCSPLOWO2_01_FULL_42_26]